MKRMVPDNYIRLTEWAARTGLGYTHAKVLQLACRLAPCAVRVSRAYYVHKDTIALPPKNKVNSVRPRRAAKAVAIALLLALHCVMTYAQDLKDEQPHVWAADKNGAVLMKGTPHPKEIKKALKAYEQDLIDNHKIKRPWYKPTKQMVWRQFRTKAIPVITCAFSVVGGLRK